MLVAFQLDLLELISLRCSRPGSKASCHSPVGRSPGSKPHPGLSHIAIRFRPISTWGEDGLVEVRADLYLVKGTFTSHLPLPWARQEFDP